MKNLIKYFSIIALAFTFGCDPLEDVYDELDTSTVDSKGIQVFEYTLNDEDYDFVNDILNDLCSCDTHSNENFDNDDEVRQYIPLVLDERFPQLENGSGALVTYQFYNGSSPDLRGDQFVYTVSDAEYDALGYEFGNFDDLEADLPVYAAYKADLEGLNPEDGNYMDVTHDYYNGSVTENDVVSRVVYVVAYGWMYAEVLPEDTYQNFFGERFGNFSNSGEGLDKIHVWLKATKLFAEEGDEILMQYDYWNGSAEVQNVGYWRFDGTNWISYANGFQITTNTLQFGKEDGVWVPDNTIRYTFSLNDFNAVAANTNLGSDNARANLAQYGNFNTNAGYWSNDDILEAVNFILMMNFPNSEEGQKFIVTYNTYPDGDKTMSVVLQGGVYVLQE